VFGRRFPISLVFPRWPEFTPTGKPLPRFCSGKNSELGWHPMPAECRSFIGASSELYLAPTRSAGFAAGGPAARGGAGARR